MRKDKHIDSSLVIDYQSGNRSALIPLVKRWHKEFCSTAFWIVKDADISKDIAQESWRTIMLKINSLNNPDRFAFWAIQIVRSKSIDYLRKERRIVKTSISLIPETVEEENDEIDERVKKKLKAEIINLPVHQQQVIRLFYVEDYSLKEIADLLNIKKGTVKSRLFHAREKLKTILKHRNYEN